MITKKTFCKILELVEKQIKTEGKLANDLQKYFNGHFVSEISVSIETAFTVLFAATLEGEVSDSPWIHWHVWDNEFGKKKLSAFIEEQEYIITSNEDFYEFLKDWRYFLTK